MRKSMIATLLAVTLLGAQATESFAQSAPAGGMEGMPGMEAGGTDSSPAYHSIVFSSVRYC